MVPDNKEATMLHELKIHPLKHNERHLVYSWHSLCSVEIYSQYTCIMKTIMLRNSFDKVHDKFAVADSGFYWGGANSQIGSTDCVKLKEFGPPEGARPWRPPPSSDPLMDPKARQWILLHCVRQLVSSIKHSNTLFHAYLKHDFFYSTDRDTKISHAPFYFLFPFLWTE